MQIRQETILNRTTIPARRAQQQPGPVQPATSADISDLLDAVTTLNIAVTALQANANGNRYTGWAVYNHGAGAQALTAGTRTKLLCNGATKNESQLPVDCPALWDTANSKILGRNGDGIVVKIQCIFTPSSAAASKVKFEIDVGGALGTIEFHHFPITDGANNAHPLSWTFCAYTLDTWAANGGTIYATADGPGSITAMQVMVQRTHKARP